MSDPRDGGEAPLPGEEPSDDVDFDLPEDDLEGEEPEAPEPEDLVEAEPQPQQRQRSRSSDTIRNLRERAQRAELERDTYRNVYQQQQRPAQPDPNREAQQRAQEYQRISMLPPEEQVAAIDRMIEQRTALSTFQSFDRQDKSDFERIKSTYPAAQRLGAQVENVLQQQRQAGVYQFSREQIYHYLLGQEVHNRSVSGASRQRANGQRNVQRQTTRPRGGRGDVGTGANRTRGDDADRRLLESIRIEDV